MSEIFITGHRNPDMDSICSAFAYAKLKNAIDPENNYIPLRAGHMTDAQKAHFSEIGVVPPAYRRDLFPRVSDVYLKPRRTLDVNAPVFSLSHFFSDTRPSVVPVTKDGEFYGLLSVDDVTSWFLNEASDRRPVYSFFTGNFPAVLGATRIKEGNEDSFSACIVIGAMALDMFKKEISDHGPAVLVIGEQEEYLKFAITIPEIKAIVITGTQSTGIDFEDYRGAVFCTPKDTAETMRLIRLAAAVGSVIGRQGRRVGINELFTDARNALTSAHLRGLAVFDNDDKFAGFLTRRCFIDTPKPKVILVDHNEEKQSIQGIEGASVIEIIDHHRLDASRTDLPIFIDFEPVGSTCTIVYNLYCRYGLTPDREASLMLLTGILADTVLLKSPTACAADSAACRALCPLAGVDDMESFGKRMFSRSNPLTEKQPRHIIEDDFKRYAENGVSFGIGQCEVTSLAAVPDVRESLLVSLEEVRKAYSLDWAMLMISDVFRNNSILLSTECRWSSNLSYAKTDRGTYLMPGVLSRKKQLLPEAVQAARL